MYNYKSLKEISYNQITKCLNLAFSDYYIPIKFTQEELQNRFELSGVDKELSYGAFLNNEMVGFIFNSCNIYNNHKSVFDVGTGVIPKHRGNKVFTDLFKLTEQELKKRKIEKYYLEVLQQNDKAISSYKKQGFTITREFSVLNCYNRVKEMNSTKAEYIEFNDFDRNKVSNCKCVNPSYEHSTNILKIAPTCYSVAYSQEKSRI